MERAAAPAKRWLSQGLETLATRKTNSESPAFDFDAIIVGSGYGAGMAAWHLSRKYRDDSPLSIAVLERGEEFVPGTFPATFADLWPQVRATFGDSEAKGSPSGLFDFRLGPDVSCLIASGLGGGSLINAGVMLRPPASVFDERWPAELQNNVLDHHYERCEELLHARQPKQLPCKFDAFARLDAPNVKVAPITVATEPSQDLSACNDCGNCATGCNFDAKVSVDVSLLAQAMRANEAMECFTGASVQRFWQRKGEGWSVEVAHTSNELQERLGSVRVSCRFLVVAAGTFGSTELLMASQRPDLRFSPRLGKGFSGNGDMLAIGYGQNEQALGVCRTTATSGAGPTITGYIDRRSDKGILIEELGVPNAIHAIFEEMVATSNTLHSLGHADFSNHRDGGNFVDSFSIDRDKMDATSIYAMMGDDCAGGELVRKKDAKGQGTLYVSWPKANKHPLWQRQLSLLQSLVDDSGVGGKVFANPFWQPLPKSLSFLFDVPTGSLFSVHPLGGCSMGSVGENGVVDHIGRVFRADTTEVYPGLVVLDGSILPSALGTNPALTIAAITDRAMTNLSVIWGLGNGSGATRRLPPRPRYSAPGDEPVMPTSVRVEERMVGDVTLHLAKGNACRTLELTVKTDPVELACLSAGTGRTIRIGDGSRIRLFRPGRYEKLIDSDPAADSIEPRFETRAQMILEVSGQLRLFERMATGGLTRTIRGLWAWVRNRGLRDFWQDLAAMRHPKDMIAIFKRAGLFIGHAIALASHAGERRTLAYNLRIDKVIKTADSELDGSDWVGQPIRGKKILTYNRDGSPLRQLMRLELDEFPQLDARASNVLMLDTRYLARIGVPLIKIVSQRDLPSSIEGLIRLGGYLVRMLLGIHVWTFRTPDEIRAPAAIRLPGRLPGVPVFEQYHLPRIDGSLLPAVVTRYRRDGGKPAIMFHGYSAGGTTFAHESLDPPFAGFLWQCGYDAWVVDFRTSPGVPTSVRSWKFEEVAEIDIPVAIDHVFRETGQSMHVVAHCMGAAMFSMAVLGGDETSAPERRLMRDHIDRVVLTQVGPGVVFSPANVFRAFILNFFKNFLSLVAFDFRPDNSRFRDRLLDRLLNILPYPPEEFRQENPAWPPWARREYVSIRHRMDMLYGRDFSLGNVSEGFLQHIDAHFGPLNLDTVSQVVPMTRWKNATTRSGYNHYYHRRRLKRHWRFPTLSIHGRDNGLSSVATLARNRRMFRDAGVPLTTLALDGFGHQDVWVSPRSEREVFGRILDFLVEVPRPQREENIRVRPWLAAPPFIGPVLSLGTDEHKVLLKLGKSPNLSPPDMIVVFAVEDRDGECMPAGFSFDDGDYRQRLNVFDHPSPDEHGMYELEFSVDRAGIGTRYLVLMIYDEHPALLDATFGEAIGLTFNRSWYAVGDDSARLRDAILTTLARGTAWLATAIIDINALPDDRLCIAFGSCQYPPTLLDDDIALASWRRMSDRLAQHEATPRPGLILLLGDQVYVDATGGFFDPKERDDKYNRPHIDLLSNDHVQFAMSAVPVEAMLDDHEINDNWEPNPASKAQSSMRDMGVGAFRSFQFNSKGTRGVTEGGWGPLNGTPLPIFMLNSRSMRSHREPGKLDVASMFGETQFADLTRWLSQCDMAVPKIVTCASMPFPRHRPIEQYPDSAITLDGFDGYPNTFDRLFSFIAEHRIQHVVFLSGDEHRAITACARLLEGEDEVARVHSVHTSALYAPFPFANSRPDDLLCHEVISLSGGRFSMDIAAEIRPSGDGFTLVSFVGEGGRWLVEGLFEGLNDGAGVAFSLPLDQVLP